MTKVNCAENQTPIIRWSYPGEDEQQKKADEYLIKGARRYADWYIEHKRADRPWYSFRKTYFRALNFTGNYKNIRANGYSLIIVEADRLDTGEFGDFDVSPHLNSEDSNFKALYTDWGYRYDWLFGKAKIFKDFGYRYDDDRITFTVKKEDRVIFTRTENRTIPDITTSCQSTQTCPENTCQVSCDTTICCYGNDGYVVTSFPKE